MSVVKDIVSLCGGVDEIILVIKDMAGVGSPSRITTLVDTIKQAYPELVIQYHRHATDGLALPALLAAARAGNKILDVEDSLTRFYGQPPLLGVHAYLEEAGILFILTWHRRQPPLKRYENGLINITGQNHPLKV